MYPGMDKFPAYNHKTGHNEVLVQASRKKTGCRELETGRITKFPIKASEDARPGVAVVLRYKESGQNRDSEKHVESDQESDQSDMFESATGMLNESESWSEAKPE
jgi:hypothetical protein